MNRIGFDDMRTAIFCGETVLNGGVITCAGHTFEPDDTKAYVEFYLSHGFPVVTSDRTAIHPQVVANSYGSLLHKVFNLGHIMRVYDAENHARDRILGSVVAVEFPPTPPGGWTVPRDPSQAPGIHGVAVMHKMAEVVAQILGQHLSGKRRWTVSMETQFFVEESGFLVGERDALANDIGFAAEATPSDLRDLGYLYVAWAKAGPVMEVWDEARTRIKPVYQSRQIVFLLAGLDGQVHYNGVRLTPWGKEPTAAVRQMVAEEDLAEAGLRLGGRVAALASR
jgi:hypothetical protein